MANEAVRDDNPSKPLLGYNYFRGLSIFYDIEQQTKLELPETLNKVFWSQLRENGKNALLTNNTNDILITLHNIIKALEHDDPDMDIEEESSTACVHGAKHYGMNNYKKGFEWSRMWHPLNRHLRKYMKDKLSIDDGPKGSGNTHRAHIIANCLMLMESVVDNLGTNDIPELNEVRKN